MADCVSVFGSIKESFSTFQTSMNHDSASGKAAVTFSVNADPTAMLKFWRNRAWFDGWMPLEQLTV
jgi:hypothetical protein